jgi:hypothetical protein
MFLIHYYYLLHFMLTIIFAIIFAIILAIILAIIFLVVFESTASYLFFILVLLEIINH